MSKRAKEFVEHWVETNIGPDLYVDVGADPRPTEYARDCLYEARSSGIPRDEIEREFGNLVNYMNRVMDASADEAVARLAGRAD